MKIRSEIVKLVRCYFDEQGFLELHTPRLVGLPGQEPYLDPMWTRLRQGSAGQAIPVALITSPEYAMKKLLAAGFDKIYDLGPCFRDGEPWDGNHDPEFLMLEWYRRDVGLEELMDDTEKMIHFVMDAFAGPARAHAFHEASYASSSTSSASLSHEKTLAPSPANAFRRMTVKQAMKQYANIDLDPLIGDREAMTKICRERGQTVTDVDTWDDLFYKIFLSEAEPKVASEPTFLYRYPVSMAALAKKDPNDPRYALRVELYAGGLELANGFEELTDPVEQRKRFEDEQTLRRSLGKKTWPIDERFLDALPKIGQASGIAFGVDRLAMLLTGTKSISDLMPIPVRERF